MMDIANQVIEEDHRDALHIETISPLPNQHLSHESINYFHFGNENRREKYQQDEVDICRVTLRVPTSIVQPKFAQLYFNLFEYTHINKEIPKWQRERVDVDLRV